MTLQELAHKENVLHSETIDIANRPQTDDSVKRLERIHLEYRQIHQCYAELSQRQTEAFKRALFIQWHGLTEPYWLTGINGLNENAENEILNLLNQIIQLDKYDYEIIWMLNYYWSIGDWTFTRLKAFKPFDQKVINEKNNKLPETIDRQEMELRGQMGVYWNSLAHFSKSQT